MGADGVLLHKGYVFLDESSCNGNLFTSVIFSHLTDVSNFPITHSL